MAHAGVELKLTQLRCSNVEPACITRTLRETSTEAAIFYAVFAPSETHPEHPEGLALVEFHDDINRKFTGRAAFTDPAELVAGATAATVAALSGWPERTGGRGHIVVDGTPQSASVLVDGAVRSNLPLDEDIDAGSYAIRVFAQGYEDFEQQVEVTAGENTSLRVDLVRQGEAADERDPDQVVAPPRPNERSPPLLSSWRRLDPRGRCLTRPRLLRPRQRRRVRR